MNTVTVSDYYVILEMLTVQNSLLSYERTKQISIGQLFGI
jgi:hypothetical protein